MKKIQFTFPCDGNEISDLSTEFISDLFLNKGEEFWCSGSGEGMFTFSTNEFNSKILVYFSSVLNGFAFWFNSDNEDGTYFSTLNNERNEEVTVWVGGDPWVLLGKMFLDRTLSLEVIKFFLDKGKKLDSLNWFTSGELNWRFGYE